MTTNHIDQLNAWYEQAEPITKANLPNDGDAIIYPASVDGSYVIEGATYGWDAQAVSSNEQCRILARAPKPKPAWHDAVAVLASTSDFGLRRVFVKDVDGMWNDALSGRGSFEGNLLDVTPLIEAKVTYEMVDRYIETCHGRDWEDVSYARAAAAAALTAALGLETA